LATQEWTLKNREQAWSALPATTQARAPRVLVIGAGMAGLVTARLLHESGMHVTILEARERTGGRLWTHTGLGVPIDLGASWVHGADVNPVANWCRAAGVALHLAPTGERRFYKQGRFERLKPLSLRAWRTLSRATVRAALLLTQSRFSGRPVSIAAAMDPLLNNARLPLFDRRLLAWMVSVSEGVEGAPAHLIDLRYWYPTEANGINALPAGGYRSLVEDAAAGLSIRCNTPIACVRMTSAGVAVETSPPDSPGELLEADAVVVTVPLGILKAGRIRFEPELPAPKRAAIERIGFGASPAGDAAMNKLVLRFEQRFWDDTNERCIVLPQTPEERGAYTNWINIEPIARAPIIMGFTGGQAAVHHDRNASDEEIVARGLASLERLTGRKPPPPTGYLITRWLSDPWTLGSYSYYSIHSGPEDRRAYAQSINDRIYFAGEGTQAEECGTVQAAMRSGEAAAAEIFHRFAGRPLDATQAPWRRPGAT